CTYWRKVFTNEPVSLDSLEGYYGLLTRDFVSIQNTSGYETLKSRGFELIKNDSLRKQIISVYEFDYQYLKKLEEEYYELQFQENYFKEINQVIAPQFTYDSVGNISSIALPLPISEADQKVLLSYLWKIKRNRTFILGLYKEVEVNLKELMRDIESEIENR
ncbi:MAG TPA: hypothetical protein DCP28_24745, partial [Cytophagales bacterium]|nr:hypothetical protein [Cytophagales bacterium]